MRRSRSPSRRSARSTPSTTRSPTSRSTSGDPIALARRMTTEPPTGLFETHLTVSDLSRSRRLLPRRRRPASSRSSCPNEAQRSSGSARPASRCSGSGRSDPHRIGLSLHVAFRTSADDVLGACDRLRSLGRHAALLLRDRDRRAERDRLDAGGRRLLPRPRRPPARVPGDARRPTPPELGIVSWSQWTGRASGTRSDG